MRHAFTLIELLVVFAIIAILALMACPLWIKPPRGILVGDTVQVKTTHVKVVVVEQDSMSAFMCRVDNGPEAHPRYQEIHFLRDELEPLTGPEK